MERKRAPLAADSEASEALAFGKTPTFGTVVEGGGKEDGKAVALVGASQTLFACVGRESRGASLLPTRSRVKTTRFANGRVDGNGMEGFCFFTTEPLARGYGWSIASFLLYLSGAPPPLQPPSQRLRELGAGGKELLGESERIAKKLLKKRDPPRRAEAFGEPPGSRKSRSSAPDTEAKPAF